MHIMLKGVIPFELGCALHELNIVKKLFTLHDLNRRIIKFCSLNKNDAKNKPPELNSLK